MRFYWTPSKLPIDGSSLHRIRDLHVLRPFGLLMASFPEVLLIVLSIKLLNSK
jgi:hypothetical protein